MPAHSQSAVAEAEVEVAPPPPKRKPRASTNSKPKPQPPYAVILHNDPINGFEYVIGVLMKIFHYGGGKAFLLTLRAHLSGRSIVWSGPKEVAEFKAEQIHSCGPDPAKKKDGAGPLATSIEPMPG